MSNGEILHQHKRFENINYEDKIVEGREFFDCTFYKSNLKGCTFLECIFEKCTFEDCDLSLIKVKRTALTGIHVINSKAIGILWCDASNPFSVSFNNSQISYSNFYGKNMKKGQFIKCMAEDVDFSECNLSSSNFTGTDLSNVRFFNTDLTGANFVDAANYFIDPRTNKVKNARFNLPGALSFLAALDIKLVD
jgi:fluoroquinolone resistance protein